MLDLFISREQSILYRLGVQLHITVVLICISSLSFIDDVSSYLLEFGSLKIYHCHFDLLMIYDPFLSFRVRLQPQDISPSA